MSRGAPTSRSLSIIAAESERWRLGVDVLLLATLVCAALSYGASEPWSQQIVAGLVAVLCLWVAGSIASRAARGFAWSWTYVPIAAFVGLIVLQVFPLPSSVAGAFSPAALSTRRALLEDLGGGGGGRITLSMFGAATVRDLRLLLLVVAVFVVTLQAYRTPIALRRLLMIIAIAGAAVVTMAMYQNLLGKSTIFGAVSMEHPNSGPFLNHSHFSQFVNLGIGAAAGLALASLAKLMRTGGSVRRLWRKLSRDRSSWVIWAALLVIVFGALVILLSMSRGGVIAALSAAAVVGALLAWRGRREGGDHAALVLAVALIVVGAALVAGFNGIYDRLATLRHIDTASGGRAGILADVAAAWRQYPLFGTGLGTFEWVFPGYDSDTRPTLTTHAENEYAQLLMETGIAGMLCIGVFLAMVARAAWGVIRRPHRSIDYAAFGLCFGVIAVLVHSASDFGQHVLAVACMSAATFAALLNLDAHRRARGVGETPPYLDTVEESDATARFAGAGAIVVLAVAAVWVGISLEGPRVARSLWAEAGAIETRIYGNEQGLTRPGDYERLLRKFGEAAAADPGVPLLQYMHDYYDWGRVGFDDDGNRVRVAGNERREQQAGEILDRLAAARRHCPTFGPNHALAGEVLFFGLRDAPVGRALIDRGLSLTPHDPFVALTGGYAAARQGDREAALRGFNRAIELNAGLRREVVDVCHGELDDPDLAYEFARGDRVALAHLAHLLRDDPKMAQLAGRCHDEVRALLIERITSDNPTADELATYARLLAAEEDYQQAIQLYRAALVQRYSHLQWRLELAQCLAASGAHREAVREAKVCLQIKPDMRAAIQLIDEQIVLSSDGEKAGGSF